MQSETGILNSFDALFNFSEAIDVPSAEIA